ncbi:MAG: hypothetical protein KDA42_12090 [Planctomycetales bacterium]|nr:hypothetical protein [Planctomycetales bacterium]
MMRRSFLPLLCVTLVAVLSCAATTMAQSQPATTVQLPTFQFFGVGTTVLVPDRGATYLGGINSSSSGASQFGVPLLPGPLFGNRAIGSQASAANTSVRVWIHDFEAMDEMLLRQAAAQRVGQPLLATAPHLRATETATSPKPERPKTDLVKLLTREAGEPEDRSTAIELQLAKARELLAAGKPGVAKIYYQMALRRSAGEQRERIAAEMRSRIETAIAASSP